MVPGRLMRSKRCRHFTADCGFAGSKRKKITRFLFYITAMYNLTANQRKVFDAIASYIGEHDGMAPTVREIMSMTGIKGSGGVAANLDALEQRGWIKRLPNRRRSITITAEAASHA